MTVHPPPALRARGSARDSVRDSVRASVRDSAGDARPDAREPVLPTTAPDAEVRCRIAVTDRDRWAHWRVRHQVFVEEQLLFAETDQDDRDADRATVHAVATCDGAVVGTVRLYPVTDDGVWQGDRLAVLPGHRGVSVGAPLVRFAVATAAWRGGHRMLAHVQLPNVRFFEYLGWHKDGPEEVYVGVPHQPMAIALGPAAGSGPAGTAS